MSDEYSRASKEEEEFVMFRNVFIPTSMAHVSGGIREVDAFLGYCGVNTEEYREIYSKLDALIGQWSGVVTKLLDEKGEEIVKKRRGLGIKLNHNVKEAIHSSGYKAK